MVRHEILSIATIFASLFVSVAFNSVEKARDLTAPTSNFNFNILYTKVSRGYFFLSCQKQT